MWPRTNIQKHKNKIWQGEQNVDKEGYAQTPEATTLQPGVIYPCLVDQAVQPYNHIICRATKHNSQVIENCVWAAGVFSNLLGFKINHLPPRDTEVLVLYTGGEHNYIIGCSSQQMQMHGGLNRSSVFFDNYKKNPIKRYFTTKLKKAFEKFGGKQAKDNTAFVDGENLYDQVDGEMEITNLLGVGVNFMQHMAQLKAGDIACVETSMIDDMVRIISANFRHHSAFGDCKIYNDGGRLNVKWEGTNADWESWGKKEHNEPRWKAGEIPNTLEDPGISKIHEQDAKYRFSQFIGFLGDFVTTFVSDPVVWEEGANYVQKERSGKSKLHLNDDGTVLVSTVKEIVLEKLPRLTVPLHQIPEYHIKGDKPSGGSPTVWMEELDKLKNWSFKSSGGEDNVHYVIYQIREYAKWLTNKRTNAQFLRHTKDWKVPPETEVPEPDHVGQEDREKKTANAGEPYPEKIKDTYATIKIAKDGSILFLDSYENTITMSYSGIAVSSHNNLSLEAAGSVNIVAGRDINLLAKKSADISAVKGGVSIRGDKFIQNYSKGGILLESDHVADGRVYEIEDLPETDQEDPKRVQGILIKTRSSHIRVESGYDMGLKSAADQHHVANGTIGVESGRYQVNNTFEVYPKSVSLTPKSQASSMFGGSGGGDGMGYARVDGMFVSEKLLANFLLQYAEDLRPMLCDENGFPGGGPFCHPFHVLTQNKEEFDTKIEKTDASRYKGHSSKGKFMYRKIKEYGTEQKEGKPYQSITQQALLKNLFNDDLITIEYEQWSVVQESKLPGRRQPWPAKDIYMKFDTTRRLYEPDPRQPKDLPNYANQLQADSYLLRTIE
jgi:hypothetical protein